MKEMTSRTKDYLVSFGECMSTRIFAAYLNKIGVKARQVCIYCIFFCTKLLVGFFWQVMTNCSCFYLHAVWCFWYRFYNNRWFYQCGYIRSNLSSSCKEIVWWLEQWSSDSYSYRLPWKGLSILCTSDLHVLLDVLIWLQQ